MSMMFIIRFELNKRKILVKAFFASSGRRAIEEAREWADSLPHTGDDSREYLSFDYDRITIQ